MDPLIHSYLPLAQPENIRIIVLEPALEHNAPLRFAFLQKPLDDLQDLYEAISYTWGLPALTCPMNNTEDGSQVLITPNLDTVLRTLRDKYDQRHLWADGICINQQDDREKEIQIPLMVGIFRNAKNVLAWLGPSTAETDSGMRYLNSLARHAARFVKQDTKGRDEWDSEACIARVLSSAFFTRLWIVQEVVLNANVIFLCGTSTITWSRLSAALIVVGRSFTSSLLLMHGCDIEPIMRVRDIWEANIIPAGKFKQLAVDITDLVSKFSDFSCTDPRDRIFALQSLATNLVDATRGVTKGVEVVYMNIDYTQDTYQTYRNFALASLATTKGQNIIFNSALARLKPFSSTHWASWVPDWRTEDDSKKHWTLLSPLTYTGTVYADYIVTTLTDLMPVMAGHDKGTKEIKFITPAATANAPDDFFVRVCTKTSTQAPATLDDALKPIRDLYLDMSVDDASSRGFLENFLCIVWDNKTIGLGALRLCLRHLWKPSHAHTPELSDDEHIKPLTEMVQRHTFFRGAIPGLGFSWFGIGPGCLEENDVLLICQKEMIDQSLSWNRLGGIYHALVLRASGSVPLAVVATDGEGEGEGSRPTAYRIVGQACLTLRSLDDEAVVLMDRSKVRMDKMYIC